MRTLRLARIAAEAEGLRLRELARRTTTRVILGVIALGFLSGAVAFAHIAAWYWLRRNLEPPDAALVLAGADIVIASVLALLAARSSPSRVELEASAVRDRAWENAKATLGVAALAMQLLRLLGNLLSRSRR